jgi:hypothetical protein
MKNKIVTKQDLSDVQYRIENEGFDYCFRCYSNFEEINDEKFHELRKAYIKAAKELENYVEDNSEEKDF